MSVLSDSKPSFSDKVELEAVNDSSFYIRRRLGILTNNLFVGLGLVCVLLTIMLRWKLAMLVSIGIPLLVFGHDDSILCLGLQP